MTGICATCGNLENDPIHEDHDFIDVSEVK